jgi:hypothetical protein
MRFTPLIVIKKIRNQIENLEKKLTIKSPTSIVKSLNILILFLI